MSLFLFLDESGDFTFNVHASTHLVFTCLSTTQPDTIAQPLTALRYALFTQGIHLERFHAAEDKQIVRDQVFGLIAANNNYEIDAVVVEKRKARPALQSYRLYPRIYSILLRYVLNRQNFGVLNTVEVICDTVPLKKKREAMEGTLKVELASLMHGRHTPYSIVFQSSSANPFLQVADYCGWAVFRKWERNDLRSYNLIGARIRSEFSVFRLGNVYYY